MHKQLRSISICSAIAALSTLAACGGGGSSGSSSGSSYASVIVSVQAPSAPSFNAGSTISLMGKANTPTTVLSTLAWTIAPAATLIDGDCAEATKTSQTYAANAQNATGTSTWTCPVSFTPSGSATVNTNYTLTLTGTDSKGNVQSASQQILVTPSPTTAASGLAANAGASFTAAPGDTDTMNCSGTGGTAPYSFQWVISGNGGYNFALSSYNAANTSFTAPAVTSAATLAFSCLVTDSVGATATSVVNATINPSTASTSALVASVAQPAAASPGQSISLNGSATGWFNTQTGASSTGPTPIYQWTSNNAQVVFANPNSATTSAIIPTSISAATTISYTLTATSGSNTSQATVNVLVDPYGPLSLSVTPPALASAGNKAVQFTANATSPSGSATIYYGWTQTSGAPLSLGGPQTATLGVVAPLVAAGTTATYNFRVAVGYNPITPAYPGLYFADVTLTITP